MRFLGKFKVNLKTTDKSESTLFLKANTLNLNFPTSMLSSKWYLKIGFEFCEGQFGPIDNSGQKQKTLSALGLPERSPTSVLTQPDAA